MNISAIPFKPSENEIIILKLWEDYQDVIKPKYLNNQIEDFLLNVDYALDDWIQTTGEAWLEYLQPMLFDFLLNGDISHEAIRASVRLKREWNKKGNKDLKISRAYSKKPRTESLTKYYNQTSL